MPSPFTHTHRLALAAGLLAAAPVAMAVQAGPWQLSGDLRGGYFAAEQTDRTGTSTDTDDFRARLRIGAQRPLLPELTFHIRAAGRFSTEQDGTRVYLRAHAPERTGARLGDVTLDELQLRYASADGMLAMTLGRFQSKFELIGVASKALDRNDSPNTEINWTDGLQVTSKLASDWHGHLILQYNDRRGNGSVTRAPLTFDETRIGWFAGLENTTPWGPVVQRVIGVTWLPNALATEGLASDARDDYTTFVAKGAAEWTLNARGLRVVVGAELGYAPETPRNTVVGAGDGGGADGFAWQASVNLHDVVPGHHLGVVYGQVGAGWLLSPDFRNNESLAEIRYQWRLHPQASFEARYRWRDELDLPNAAPASRESNDLYARVTLRF